jgi:DNA (cytosine-5)-methyltransferase 1
LYCIGFREDTDFKYPCPIQLDKTVYDFLLDDFDTKYFLKQKGVNFITRSINYEKSYTQVNGDIMLCQKRNQQFNWHGDFVFHPKLKSDTHTPENDVYLYRVADYEEDYYVSHTPERYALTELTDSSAHMRKVGKRDIDVQYGRFRKFTPRECLRMMGFDDSFKIVVSDTETYRQAGNSIIVDVLMALLKQMDITKYGV